MVEALSISTIGLGGDSQVTIGKNPEESLSLGPKRHVPLSIKALEYPIMLETLKKNKNSKKQFYGINSGNYGFLMNKFSSKNIVKNLSKANMVSISPLEMIVKNKNNQTKKSLAINEVSVLRPVSYTHLTLPTILLV